MERRFDIKLCIQRRLCGDTDKQFSKSRLISLRDDCRHSDERRVCGRS